MLERTGLNEAEVTTIVRTTFAAHKQVNPGGPALTEGRLNQVVRHVEELLLSAAMAELILRGEAGFAPTGDDPEEWLLCPLSDGGSAR